LSQKKRQASGGMHSVAKWSGMTQVALETLLGTELAAI
jgi:hypothetical protein